MGNFHVAILKGKPANSQLVPSMRVKNLHSMIEHLLTNDIEVIQKPMEIGAGKTISTFKDVDNNSVRLIQID